MHFTAIPMVGGSAAEEDLNAFLAAHRVVSVERHLVMEGAHHMWGVCVLWEESPAGSRAPEGGAGKPKVDYRQELSAEDFVVYAKLRDLRTELAKRDGVPPYTIFTNEQLADMARRRVKTVAALAQVEGVGQARITKHAAAFLEILKAAPDAPEKAPP